MLKTVSDLLAAVGGVKWRKDGTNYRVLRQEGLRVPWYAVGYETVDRATVLGHENFELLDGTRRGLDVEDAPGIKDDEDELFDKPD